MLPDWSLALFFALIAFVYASAGFGGGSSYLALLAVAGLPFQEIRLTALICNVIVVSGGTWLFFQHKLLNAKKILPLVIASVPAAFLGARMKISQDTFFLLLGVCLVATSGLLWFQAAAAQEQPASDSKPLRDGFWGASIGCLSGMVGIGGGIFLSPLLHFTRWDTARKIAATASVFILVNSLAGLAGQLGQISTEINGQRIAMLGAAVLLGGQAGARISIAWFRQDAIRRITAALVLAAGIEVLLRHWK